MGMAPYHFVVEPAANLEGVELALFPGDLTVEDDLKEKIAQFFTKFVGILTVESFENFEGFLHQHRFEGFARLLPIPWASIRAPEFRHQLEQFLERVIDARA